MNRTHEESLHDSGDRWLEDELRRVPLPKGMLARLRKIAADGRDDLLDAQLRAVAVPEGLLDRLLGIVADEQLDAAIADVSIPAGLAVGLRKAVEDAQLDEAVADVPVSTGLLDRLREIPLLERPRRLFFGQRWRAVSPRRMALAASLLLTVGLAYYGSVSGWLAATFWARPGSDSIVAVESPEDESSADRRPSINSSGQPPLHADGASDADERSGDETDGAFSFAGLENPWNPLADWARSARTPEIAGIPSGEATNDWAANDWATEDLGTALSRWIARAPRSNNFDLRQTLWRDRFGLFGAEAAVEGIPPLETLRPTKMMGVLPPRVRGFDRMFLARYDVHPFVSPAAHESLRAIAVPLVTETTSFDALWQDLAERRDAPHGLAPHGLPTTVRIRPEEFLAAMDYGFRPAADGTLALRTAAGPAPFAPFDAGRVDGARTIDDRRTDEVRLLQIGVVAGSLPKREHPPTHLTVAVDTSAPMQWRGRIDMVRRALETLAGQLGPRDRLSLVAFSDDAEVVVHDVSVQDGAVQDGAVQDGTRGLAVIRRAISTLAARHGTNLGAGLQVACATALDGSIPKGARRQLVVLSDAPPKLSEVTLRRIEQMLAAAAREGLETTFVDMSQTSETSPQLVRLARSARGVAQPGDSFDAIRWVLVERLIDRSQVVAGDAELVVTFNPKAVKEYRLIGHEGTAGLLSGSIKANLRAGQSATALFQVVLLENNVDDVATAEVTWYDSASGGARRANQRISRLQFATSLADSAISLQAAAVAAQTAEVLRGSYFAPDGSHSLERVRDVALAVHPSLRKQAAFRRLLTLAESAQKAGLERARP